METKDKALWDRIAIQMGLHFINSGTVRDGKIRWH